LLEELHIQTDELHFHFVTDKALRQLHATFFNDPSSTDCITFPLDPVGETLPYHALGEAFICPKTALLYAKQHKIDPYEELYRYIVHCLLHLMGYEDTEPAARSKMKKKEGSCLKKLLQAGLCVKNLK
jgi:probable rRNA maturation factor